MSTTVSTDSDSALILPIVTIQPTFLSVISEVDSGVIPFDTFWVSCYKTDQPSVHAKVDVSLDEIRRDVVNLEPKEGVVEIKPQGARMYTVACRPLAIPHTRILLPRQEYADPERANPQHPQRITAFDVSCDASQFATGFHDGSVHIYPIFSSPEQSYSTKTTCKAHLSSVTSLRFFPSSRVLLTAGADFSLKILPAELPSDSSSPTTSISPARILRGHLRTITSTAIISRGRNILSSALDGTIKLWDVGSGQQIHSFNTGKGKHVPVLAMALGEKGDSTWGIGPYGESGEVSGAVPVDEREVDTGDKVVFCALQDGSFEAFDLSSKRSVFQNPPASFQQRPALSSIAYSSTHNLLATGSIHGQVTVFDTRSLSNQLTSFSRNTACIEDLSFTTKCNGTFSVQDSHSEHAGLVVATEDGLPFVAGIRPDGPTVLAELAGGDCDGVRTVRILGQGEVWTAADDGIVRQY